MRAVELPDRPVSGAVRQTAAQGAETNEEGETGMKGRAATIAVTIIVNACIWGFAMIMCAHTLRGTGAYQQIQNILAGSATASLFVVMSGLVLKGKKAKQGE